MLLSVYYVVLAAAVFFLLWNNVNGIASGMGLVKNAFLKDNAFFLDSLLLVDNNPGKGFNAKYEVPETFMLVEENGRIKTRNGIIIEYNQPTKTSFKIMEDGAGIILSSGGSD